MEKLKGKASLALAALGHFIFELNSLVLGYCSTKSFSNFAHLAIGWTTALDMLTDLLSTNPLIRPTPWVSLTTTDA